MESRNAHIQRAAALTQKLFFQFGEMNFSFQLVDIKEKDGELLIKTYLPQQGKFIKFDPNVVMTGKQKSMVVSHLACSSAVIFFRDLLTKFLEGTNTRVGVTNLSLTPPDTITQWSDVTPEYRLWRCHKHTLFKIFDKGKDKADEADKANKVDKADERDKDRPAEWFIDLAGPQFSIFNPCLKPEDYCKEYKTSKLIDSDPNIDLKDETRSYTEALEFRMTECIITNIEGAIEAWENKKKVRIEEMLASGEHESLEIELLGFVEETMGRLRENFDWTEYFIKRDGPG